LKGLELRRLLVSLRTAALLRPPVCSLDLAIAVAVLRSDAANTLQAQPSTHEYRAKGLAKVTPAQQFIGAVQFTGFIAGGAHLRRICA
jgi:hypothetical protein